MFGFLRDKLKKSVSRLAERIREEPAMPDEAPAGARQVKAEKPGKAAKRPKPSKAAAMPAEKHAERKPLKAREKPKRPLERPEPEPEPEPEPQPSPEPEPPPEPEPGPEPPTPDIGPKSAGGHEDGKGRGFFGRLMGIKSAVTEKMVTDDDIDSFFAETETDLLQANIAVEAIDYMKDVMKKDLANRRIKRRGAEELITRALEDGLLGLVSQGEIDIEGVIRKVREQGRPACFIFLGMNGSGKTTSIAKVAHFLAGKKYSVVLAAGDTFRAASIEQLEYHGNKLGLKVVKHGYGADGAAVIFDARKHAESRGVDVVLADTAGRTHVDKNLMEELKKVIRVNKPDLKILVVDSLTGNDAVEQAKSYHQAVGVDCVIMAKVDVNEKGGSILSVSYAIKKPVLFLGTGQGYGDLERFVPEKFVKELME